MAEAEDDAADESPAPAVDDEAEQVSETPATTPTPVATSAATGARPGMGYHSAHTKRGLLLVGQAVAAIGAVFVGIVAIQGELITYGGIVAALVTLAAVLLVLHTGASTSRVTLDQGNLEVVHGDNRHRFDLTADSTEVEHFGDPGEPDWHMQIARRGLSPVTITPRVVDPEPFTEAVLSWRPRQVVPDDSGVRTAD